MLQGVFLIHIGPGEVIAKLDFSNAFNSVHRDSILKAVAEHIPEIYALCHSAYGAKSQLLFGNHIIDSSSGVQQGDPLGPLLFSLTLQPILEKLSSSLKFAYLDDVTLGGPSNIVSNDIEILKTESARIGLKLNVFKCEVITSNERPDFDVFSNFVVIHPCDAILLGAALLHESALDEMLNKIQQNLHTATENSRKFPFTMRYFF